ncbi:MAG TPA: ATP-binding cassette domain-containing protein, partial [Polyangiaceae bacterium]|nr:ATP-binding cassette domain-containing protein [Polyangiaceae bacterium]
MADVELRNVSRQFEGAPSRAVDDLSLHVASGEFLVLVGPSGCGKSTALRMIAGLEEITAGAIAIG